MLTKEDLNLLSEMMSKMMDDKLKPINNRLDSIEETLEVIKEDAEITREVVNEISKWVEVNSDPRSNPYPVN